MSKELIDRFDLYTTHHFVCCRSMFLEKRNIETALLTLLLTNGEQELHFVYNLVYSTFVLLLQCP